MIIMQLNDLSKSFGADPILKNIKLEIKNNDRIAIVGRNGCGKSTLLKIMAGELTHDEGELIKPRDLTLGYLSQHTDLQSNKTIWKEMVQVFQPLLNIEQKIRSLEQQMEKTAKTTRTEYEQLLHEYDNLQQSFEREGGYDFEANIKAILSGLNFHEKDYHTTINTLSGGQKTRLALGKLLLQKPDLLILDEPTNHLDIDTMSWLESFLQGYSGAVVIVSHDRYFLEQTISIIYEISFHRIKKYVGGYRKFLEQREADYIQQLKAYEQQQEEIKQAEEFVVRNIARASTTKRAQSRRKQLENMEVIDKPLGDESSAKFSFDINRRSGNDVLKVEQVSFEFEKTQPIFSHASFQVNRGDRIALVGPNGVGKTTLLKLIVNMLNPTSGVIEHGTNVQIGYYDQEQDLLTPSNSVLDELWDEHPMVNERDVRTVLGNFLFSGEDVLYPVHSLSGGEKARLSLAKLMMQKANLLILDEPTNHLDIDSKEILEGALANFPGTIIFVSHDRYFINEIADQVIEMNRDGTTVYLGDYDYYVEKKQEEKERALLKETESKESAVKHHEPDNRSHFEDMKKKQREERRTKRRISKVESTIEQLEMTLTKTEDEMAQPEVFQDHERSLELSQKADQLKMEIEEFMEEWTSLHE